VTTKRLIASVDGDVWLDMKDHINNSGGGVSAHDLWKVTSISTGEHCVMKCYKSFSHDDLLAELCATRDLAPHPNIMRFKKVIETEGEAFVLCEFLDGMDMYSFYESYQGGVSEAKAKRLFRQILDAFAHLHDTCEVLHNDVKLENLFVVGTSSGEEDDLQAKIIDFGLACFPGREVKVANEGTCALAYSAPEILDATQRRVLPEHARPRATKELDIFRLGVVLYVILTTQFPYPPVKPADPTEPCRPLDKLKAENKLKWSALSPACRAFVGHLLAFDPSKRPTAAAALQDAWFH